jgi:hypothetical protein
MRLRKIDHTNRACRISHSFRVRDIGRCAFPNCRTRSRCAVGSAINFYSLFRWVRSLALGPRLRGVRFLCAGMLFGEAISRELCAFPLLKSRTNFWLLLLPQPQLCHLSCQPMPLLKRVSPDVDQTPLFLVHFSFDLLYWRAHNSQRFGRACRSSTSRVAQRPSLCSP